jgi:uncharacterized protein involved in exopolysaccharide biosynthesis
MTGLLPPPAWYVAIRDLGGQALKHWRQLVLFTLVGGTAGGVTAVLLPSYYESGAAFQAEANPPSQMGGALAGLAAQFGNIQIGPQNTAQFFGDLLRTDAVLGRVVQANMPWRGSWVPLTTVYDLADKPDGLREFTAAKKLRSAMNVDVNVRTGVVRFAIEARAPELAEAIAETVLVTLNTANIELRRIRAAAERQFTNDRAEHARQELDSAERALTGFYQRNRLVAGSPSLQMVEAKLKRTVDMAQQVYTQLRLQEEQAAVQEVRNTPTISVFDPPLVPVRRSWPKRRTAVLAGCVIGLALGFARILVEW